MAVSRQVSLIILAFVAVFAIFTLVRFSRIPPDYRSFSSLLVERCAESSSRKTDSDSTGAAGRGGAFYRPEDIATKDEDWGRKVCAPRELTNLKDFHDYLRTPTLRCDTQLMLGGHLMNNRGVLDGNKWLCIDKKYKVTPVKCIVYSFGIGGDWAFEKEVERKLGCKVLAFDPTIGKQSHNVSAKISFFNLGIGGVTKTGPDVKKKVDRFSNILAEHGHLNSVIDVLKMDVEGNEIPFFRDMFENTPNLLKNVKMIAMEVHIVSSYTDVTNRHKEFWKFFQRLDCFGFKIWHSDVNPFCGVRIVNQEKRASCYEVVWVQDREW